jgi:hypothetical protein
VNVTEVGNVVLPTNTTDELGVFLGNHLTKTKGHKDTLLSLTMWKTFLHLQLGGSTDCWLERCSDDNERAKVLALFMKNLHELGMADKRICKHVTGVKHQFQVSQKNLGFFDETLVKSMRQAIKPTTSQIRALAIERAQNVKLPVPEEVTDHMHAMGWVDATWDWNGTGTRAVSAAGDLSLYKGFRASNVVAPGKDEEDHAVRYSDVVILVQGNGHPRRVTVGVGLVDIDENDVVGFTAHVYSTKTGGVVGNKIPYTVMRDTELGNRLVTKIFQWTQRMVTSPLFTIDDPLFTAYRQKGAKWFRRLTRRSDLTLSVKNGGEEFGIPREHLSSSSYRKAAATDMRLSGGSDKEVADVGLWAVDKSGRSSVAGKYYDLASATGRRGMSGGQGVSVQEVLNMVPISSDCITKKSSTKKAASVVVKKTRKGPKTGRGKKAGAIALSPKVFNKKGGK